MIICLPFDGAPNQALHGMAASLRRLAIWASRRGCHR